MEKTTMLAAMAIVDELRSADLRDASGRCVYCRQQIYAPHVKRYHAATCLVLVAQEFFEGSDEGILEDQERRDAVRLYERKKRAREISTRARAVGGFTV